MYETDPLEKKRRAQAYMAMVGTDGWKYLQDELNDRVAKATKLVMGKTAWVVADERATGEMQVAQVRAWAYGNIIKHVEKQIKSERDANKADQGDSPK